jgi:hypothetical protein
MPAYATELGSVRFNPETQCYEALVTFHEGGHAERYPCSLSFGIDADPAAVAHALVRQARALRSRSRVPLRSRLIPRQTRYASRA